MGGVTASMLVPVFGNPARGASLSRLRPVTRWRYGWMSNSLYPRSASHPKGLTDPAARSSGAYSHTIAGECSAMVRLAPSFEVVTELGCQPEYRFARLRAEVRV